jgi:hypothetical protein
VSIPVTGVGPTVYSQNSNPLANFGKHLIVDFLCEISHLLTQLLAAKTQWDTRSKLSLENWVFDETEGKGITSPDGAA